MQLRLWKKASTRRRGEPRTMLWQILYGVVVLACVSLLLFLIWYVTRLPAFTISDISIEGGETISHEEVRARIEDELRGDYLRIIPHRFSFFYPHDAIIETLKRIPRIHDITLVRKDRTKLNVSFSEYKPSALWCTPQSDTSECYFLDDQGFAFAPSPVLAGGALIRHMFEERTTLEVGHVMSAEEFANIQNFLTRLKDELSLRITDVFHTKDNDLYFGVNGGGEVRVAGGDSFEQVFENLKSILTSKDFKHLEPGNFQYIDLRFGNKIFVNEEELLPATSTPTTTSVLPE